MDAIGDCKMKKPVAGKTPEGLLIEAMKATFGGDERRIKHALAVLDYAKRISEVEGGDFQVILSAAVLHDIGIHEAERKYGSPAGHYQEIEGPPIAREILDRIGMDEDRVDHVCRIIANHHSDRDIDTTEFRVIWDADWLVNIPVWYPEMTVEELQRKIDRVFKTGAGRKIAYSTLLPISN